jgi:hypothetical protein
MSDCGGIDAVAVRLVEARTYDLKIVGSPVRDTVWAP